MEEGFDVGNPNELVLSAGYAWAHIVAAAAPRYGGLHEVPDEALRVHREVFVGRPLAREVANGLRGALHAWGLDGLVVPDVEGLGDVSRPPPGFGAMALPRVDPAFRLTPTWLVVHSLYQLLMGAGAVPNDAQMMNMWLLRLEGRPATLRDVYASVSEYCSASRTLEWFHRAEPARVTYSPRAYTVSCVPRVGGGVRVTLRTDALALDNIVVLEGTVPPPGFGAAHCVCNGLLNGLAEGMAVYVRDAQDRILEGPARTVTARITAGVLEATFEVLSGGSEDSPPAGEECEVRVTSTFFHAHV
jgi:hypothetical protein